MLGYCILQDPHFHSPSPTTSFGQFGRARQVRMDSIAGSILLCFSQSRVVGILFASKVTAKQLLLALNHWPNPVMNLLSAMY